MTPSPLAALLRAVGQRRRVAAVLAGGAVGGVLAVLLCAFLRAWLSPVGMLTLWWTLAAAGGLAQWARLVRSPRADADCIEQAAPQAQNLVRTAVELAERGVSTAIAARVLRDAETRVRGVAASRVVPLRRVATLAVLPLLGVGLMAAWRPIVRTLDTLRPEDPRRVPALTELRLLVRPPPYTGQASASITLPEQLDVLSGTALHLEGRLRSGAVVITHGATSDTIPAAALGTGPGLVVTSDALITLTPLSDDGRAGTRHLLALRVHDDAPPRVRILAPARDLRVSDGGRRLDVTVEASDDIALQSLHLRFTRVRGAGEQFAFLEGDAALEITRDGTDRWRARTTLRLDTLQLEPGDVVVYRALARDTRPGSAFSESESFLVEVTAPGAEAVEGFAADEDQDRYGLSQAMVILKTERLLAAERTMSAEEARRATLTLAAEQRSVRAEFVFMMGGELADDANDHAGHLHLNEEAEAEAEDDILAGRLANQGRLEMTRAVRAMSAAAQLLTAGALRDALVEERRALAALERALARSRFILRALSTRERVDPARRLTGDVRGVVSSPRVTVAPVPATSALALRDAVALLVRLTDVATITVAEAQDVARVAQRLLVAFPGDSAVLGVAESMLRDLHPEVEAARRGASAARSRIVLGRALRTTLPLSTARPAPLGWRAVGGSR